MNHKMFQYGSKSSRLMPASPFPCGFPDKNRLTGPIKPWKYFLVTGEAVLMPKKARNRPFPHGLKRENQLCVAPPRKVACEPAAASVYSFTGVNAETDHYVPTFCFLPELC
jgi:hypothetical protein